MTRTRTPRDQPGSAAPSPGPALVPDTATTDVPPVDDDTLVTWWGLVLEGTGYTVRILGEELREQGGLHGPEFEALLRLSRSPGGQLPLSRLAREMSFSSGGFTKLVDRLVAAGLVERKACPADRRVTFAALTQHGRHTLDLAYERHVEGLRRHVVDKLGVEAFRQLSEIMRRLRDAAGGPQ